MAFDFDPYNILGVSPSADSEQIKTAYRKLARRLHPDTNGNNPSAVRQLQDVTAAHDLLIDSNKRRNYDDRVQQISEDLRFNLRVMPSRRTVVIVPEQQVLYLLAEITPDLRAIERQEKSVARLNLTLVLDHSNSMNGVRLEKVKTAAHQIIDSLNPADIISVVIFNDRAQVLIPATPVKDKMMLKARITLMDASGGTEIYHGLSTGVEQNRLYASPKMVNHVILLTDGRTFGDEEQSFALADKAAKDGITISAMGLGNEWNDIFLDALVGKTGGSSIYINSASQVVRFLNDHVRSLVKTFAERIRILIASESDVVLEQAFKLAPHPQPLQVENGELMLGSLPDNRSISVLLQIQLPPNLQKGLRPIARLVAEGDILENKHQQYRMAGDIEIEVVELPVNDPPPTAIIDALSKLTLYRLQERAQEALERGDYTEATRRLEHLATRLLEMGENELANQTLSEARRVAHTNGLSDKGRMTIKYQTRYLLLGPGQKDVNNDE